MTRLHQPTEFPGWSTLLSDRGFDSGVLLLLDFDGTLSDIAATPEAAVLRSGNADALGALSKASGNIIGVISGRSLDDVSALVGLPELVYAGNHGMEIRGAGLEYLNPYAATTVASLGQIAARLEVALDDIPGTRVENKTLTLTVHYRQTPDGYHDAVKSIVNDVAGRFWDTGLYRTTTAKAAIELKPAVDWDKGRALDFIRTSAAPNALPIYFGDDLTDEDAFLAARFAGGYGVFIGPAGAPTCANYRLDSPAAVTDVLNDLASRLPKRSEEA